MSASFAKIEKSVFRNLNSWVEPAVRKGIGSPTMTPASLIVLETLGFKSGARRRTPLWSLRLGQYRIVSTVRGDRSFWVKNLLKQPKVSYYLGGRRREGNAIVFAGSSVEHQSAELPRIIRGLSKLFSKYTEKGWAFAVLIPA